MTLPPDTAYREIGLAEHKYLASDELDYRREVARHIRIIAGYNRSDWILPGWEKLQRRQQMLLRQADRYETCRVRYSKIGCTECGRMFVGPHRCEVRICEHCAKKFALKLRKRQLDLVKKLKSSPDGRRAMFFTGTLVRHPLYGPTHSDVDRLFGAFKKLMHSEWPTAKGCGALAGLEIGENFNLHIHALVYGHYVNKFKLSRLWKEFTGDSQIIRIKEVKKPEACINYLLKYITKPDPRRDPERAAKWLALMVGQRRIRTYGIFYGKVKLFAPAKGCPCPFCEGKLGLIGFDEGKRIPKEALLWDEAFKLAAETEN